MENLKKKFAFRSKKYRNGKKYARKISGNHHKFSFKYGRIEMLQAFASISLNSFKLPVIVFQTSNF